jgi:hypothetical protein
VLGNPITAEADFLDKASTPTVRAGALTMLCRLHCKKVFEGQ